MTGKVVLISSDASYLGHMAAIIKKAGFNMEDFRHFPEALRHVNALEPHIIVLDENIVEWDVWQCCALLRKRSLAPILITGPAGESRAMIKAINQGADFYLKRPFQDLEFIARLKSLVRRYQISVAVSSAYPF